MGRFNWRPCFNHSANGAKLSTMKRHFHRCRGSISLDKRTPSSAGPRETRRVVESLFPVTQSSTAKPRPSQSPARQFDPIPLLDLHRQYQQIREEVLAAVERVCSSQQYILGAEVEALEREIAAFTGKSSA